MRSPLAVTRFTVSVVVPARNAARWAEPLVATLRAQTHPDWEAIVVDDGSTDDTVAAFESAAAGDPRFRIVSQQAAGVSAARNRGISEATGEWLHFLDADDRVAATWFASAAEVVAGDPAIEFVRCGWARETPGGAAQVESYPDLDSGAVDLFEVLATCCPVPIHGYLVRRSVVREVGEFDTSLVVAEDWDLLLRVARRGVRQARADGTLAFYRLTEGSASGRDFERVCRDTLEVVPRAHAADPRVPDPQPQYANGAPADRLPAVHDAMVLWTVACAVGAGAHHRAILDAHQRRAALTDSEVAATLFHTVPIAARVLRQDWPALWPRMVASLDAVVADVAVWSGDARRARQVTRQLERLIVVDARRSGNARSRWGVLRSPRLTRAVAVLAAERVARTVRRR